MGSQGFDHPYGFDTSAWAQTQYYFHNDFLAYLGPDLDTFNTFPQPQTGAIFPEYPVHPSCDDTLLPAHHNWDDTPTATNPSSTSTPLPSSDQGSSDNDLHHLVPLVTKRKLVSNDQPSTMKRHKSADDTTHTAENRRTGACLHCQKKTNKHGCKPGPDPNGPCMACLKKANALGVVIECRRNRFQDIKVFRLGPTKDIVETLRWRKPTQDPERVDWKRITNLPVRKCRQTSQNYVELRLSQGHSANTLNLRVQEFDPVESDKTSYPWYENGVAHSYQCPNYAIADRDHAADQIRRFIDLNTEQYVRRLLPRSSDPAACFVRTVFEIALVHDSYLVALTLKFWAAGRFIEDPWMVQGPETLGMKPDPSPSSPYYRHVPVTPMMNFQIDNIVIYDHLTSMLDKIRKAMKDKIMPLKKEDWFEIHLATFIILHHVDLTMKHDIQFASLRNMSSRFSNQPLIEMITFSANALLSFHQHEQGHFPLSAPKWSDVEASHNFNEMQKSYLLQARKLIQQIEVPRNAGDDLFWTSQIYHSSWQPKVVEVV